MAGGSDCRVSFSRWDTLIPASTANAVTSGPTGCRDAWRATAIRLTGGGSSFRPSSETVGIPCDDHSAVMILIVNFFRPLRSRYARRSPLSDHDGNHTSFPLPATSVSPSPFMMVKRPSVERKAISRKGSGDHENVYIHA